MRAKSIPKNNKILLVEDSRLTAKAVAELLNKNGYEVETTATGEEAVQKISGGFPSDLVLMDIELAGEMDGIDAVRRIMQFRDIPVVFLASSTSGEIIDKIKEIKAYGFVSTDTNQTVFLATIETALKLHAANSTLSIIVDSVRDAIAMLDTQGNVVFWNLAAERIFGYSREEVLGKELHRLVVANEYIYAVSSQAFIHFQSTGKGNAIGKTIELKAKHKDGRELDVELSLAALRIRDAWHAVGIVRDISERMRLEEEKKLEEERLRLMLEGIPSPAWLVSRERRILAQNKTAVSLFKTQVGEYCWKSIHDMKRLPEYHREAFQKSGSPMPGTKCYFCRAGEALDKNEQLSCEKDLDGTIWDIWWIPLGEEVYLHYATDVTMYKKIEEELRHLSVTDILTNAYNRRYFTQQLDEEMERTKRAGSGFSLVMLDIDRFKSINDRFGHNAGDLVLKSIVELIKNRIRKIDTLARWGGEEFVILLPDTTVNKAAILAEELRESLRQMDIPDVDRVTASFGVAGFCPGDTVDTLMNKADNMMYEAKAAGRNCVRYMN